MDNNKDVVNVCGFNFYIKWEDANTGYDQFGNKWINKAKPVCTNEEAMNICFDTYNKIMNLNKEAMKKTAVEPFNPSGGDIPATDEDIPTQNDLDAGLGDLGGDVGGGGGLGDLGGGGLGGGLGGDPLGGAGGLGGAPEGLGNEYYDSLKVTHTPDLEKKMLEDDDEMDWSELA